MLFWLLAAGLLILALLFVVTPLLVKRTPPPDLDQDQLNLEVFRSQIQELEADLAAGDLSPTQYKAARRDLERELLYDVGGASAAAPERDEKGAAATAVALAAVVPICAVALYLLIGNSAIIPRLEAVAAGAPPAPEGHPSAPGGNAPSLDQLVERLANKLEQDPENFEGWLMLGRSYFATGQPQKGLAALERAYVLAPRNPDVILTYAQAAASQAGGELAGRPAELIRSALEIDPDHFTARWLDGLIAYQAQDYAAAVERWEGMLAGLDRAGEEAAELSELIADARRRGGLSAPETSAAPPVQVGADAPDSAAEQAPPAASATGPAMRVQVALAESLWPVANRNDALFVYAKAASGPPMPLAVKRLRVADLPVTVTLDDSLAMTPELRLSAFAEVTVGARVSKSGQALPQSGDLEGEVDGVKPGETGTVEVLIDRVRP